MEDGAHEAYITHLAKLAYDAYCDHADWKNFEGKPIPQWDELPESTGVQEKWRVAIQEVLTQGRLAREDAAASLHDYLQRNAGSAPNGFRLFLDSVCAAEVTGGPWLTVGIHPLDVDGETVLLHIDNEHVATCGKIEVEHIADPVKECRAWRGRLDDVIQAIKSAPSERTSRERSLAITKIQEGVMWLGMDLKAQREEGLHEEPNPYPNSYDGGSDAPVAPTADGLKL